MVKELRLIGAVGRFNNDDNYINAENDELEIKITTAFNANTTLFYIVNGKTFKINNKSFKVDKSLIKPGKLEITIHAYTGNVKVGSYACMPLIIQELDKSTKVIEEVEEFRAELKSFKNDIENMKDTLNKFKDLLEKMIIAE